MIGWNSKVAVFSAETVPNSANGAIPLASALRLSVEVADKTDPIVVCTIVETLWVGFGEESVSVKLSPNGPLTDAEA